MRTKMAARVRLGSTLAVLASVGLVAAGHPASAAERYMVAGLPFFDPYRISIATIDVNGGKVTGTLAPPAGDARAALPLSGTLADGVLHLTIGSGAEAYTLSFSQNERGLHRIWEETATVPGINAVSLFRPQAGFGEPALVLRHDSDNWCGGLYGGLSVNLRAADLASQQAAPAGLADLEAIVEPQQGGTAKVKLKDLWGRLRLAARSGDDVAVDIALPVGTEAKMAQEIRRLPQVVSVDLPGQCRETALTVIPRAKVADGDKVSEAKLRAYAEAMLTQLLSGAAPDGTAAGQRKFKLQSASVAAGADGQPVYRAVVTGEAEATRLGKGSWDQYTLTLTPLVTATDAADTISLIPSVGDLKGAKKAGAQPPADSAFKPVDDSEVVGGITQRFVSWLAAAEGSRCVFLTRMPFDEPEGSLSCANVTLDEAQLPEEN